MVGQEGAATGQNPLARRVLQAVVREQGVAEVVGCIGGQWTAMGGFMVDFGTGKLLIDCTSALRRTYLQSVSGFSVPISTRGPGRWRVGAGVRAHAPKYEGVLSESQAGSPA